MSKELSTLVLIVVTAWLAITAGSGLVAIADYMGKMSASINRLADVKVTERNRMSDFKAMMAQVERQYKVSADQIMEAHLKCSSQSRHDFLTGFADREFLGQLEAIKGRENADTKAKRDESANTERSSVWPTRSRED